MDCVREPAIVTSDSDVTRQDLRGKFAEKLRRNIRPVLTKVIAPLIFSLKNSFRGIEVNDFHIFLPRAVLASAVAALTS
jgi:hypothetical protein